MKNGGLLSKVIAGLLAAGIIGGVVMYGDIQAIKTDITNIKSDIAGIKQQLDGRSLVSRGEAYRP